MPDCHNRMMENHPWSRKFHNFPYFLFHVRLVTMHLTIGAECLRLHKGTFITALHGICLKFRTLWAKYFLPVMLLFTIQSNHHGNYSLFFFPFRSYIFYHNIFSFSLPLCQNSSHVFIYINSCCLTFLRMLSARLNYSSYKNPGNYRQHHLKHRLWKCKVFHFENILHKNRLSLH